MRDPKRIDKMLKTIGGVWKLYPDLRLMQLLLNLADSDDTAYYIEDSDLIKRLFNWREKVSENNKSKL